MFRVLRVLRLIKLVRLLKASRIYERWRTKITLTFAQQTYANCVLALLLGAHWFSCVIALQASMHANIDDTIIGSHLYGFCVLGSKDGVVQTKGSFNDCENLGVGTYYLAAFSWSMMILTGTGGTDFYPSSRSDAETLIVTILVVIAAFIWTTVLAAFCDVATNDNKAVIEFRQSLDGLNAYIAINSLPKEMARRMRSYLHQMRGVMLSEEAKNALPLLSPALQVEAALFINTPWMNRVWFVRDLEDPVKVRLAQAMDTRVLAPGEVAPNRHLYVIQRGSIMFGTRLLTRGMTWGDDVVLTDKRYFLKLIPRAVGYVEIKYVHRDELYEDAADYPASLLALRRCTVWLAVRRGVIVMAREHRARQRRSEASAPPALDGQQTASAGSSSTGNSPSSPAIQGGDFMDRMYDATLKLSTVTVSQKKSMALALELGETNLTTDGGSDGELKESMERLERRMTDALVALTQQVASLAKEVKESKGARVDE